MEIRIEIGEINENTPIFNWASQKFFDVYDVQKKAMYQFLIDNNENCIISNVDMFLLYMLNNGIMANLVKDNPKIRIDDDDYHAIPKFDPNVYKIFEINENGEKKNIQNESGTINYNYFNSLMGSVMDDFYDCLTYLEKSNLNENGRIK